MLRRKLFNDDSNDATTSKQLKTSDSPIEENASFSKYFVKSIPNHLFAHKVLTIQLELNDLLNNMNFFKPPIEYIYNPLEYAFEPNEIYVKKYCSGSKKVLLVGMNPGPFGMCQTGVPFGDVEMVKNWLGVMGQVDKPIKECPTRLITGFSCTRREQSGQRFWSLFQTLSGSPENFFKHCYVYNYCPLAFMKGNGCNVTPSELKGDTKKELEQVCDQAYSKIVQLLNPEIIIGVGEYAEKKTRTILKGLSSQNIKILRLPHPSPRSLNNTNWPEKAEKFFRDHNLLPYLSP